MSQVKCRYMALKALMLTAFFSISAQAAVDRDAWISASLLGTTEAYESFLEYFPDTSPTANTRSRPWKPWPTASTRRRAAMPVARVPAAAKARAASIDRLPRRSAPRGRA